MARRPLSVIVTTYNEADHIGPCLDSVAGLADDILVVDSFSTDDTLAVLENYPARVLQRAYQGPAEQKNWAIPQAQHEWILLLDADERVTPALYQEISTLLEADAAPDKMLYWIRRSNYFLGQRIRYSGWQGDRVIRFFQREHGLYDDVQVHEEIVTEGKCVGQLTSTLDHYTFRNMEHYLDKTRRYARWSAQDHAAHTPRVGYFHLFLKPLFRFFKHYFLQQGFRDGKVGLIVSAVMAWGVFLRYAYLRESQSS